MHKYLEVFCKNTQLIVYIIRLLDIFDVETQIKANNIVDASYLTQLFFFFFFFCVAFVTLVLSYIDNKKERANLRKKIKELKKKIKNKKRKIANLTTKLKK